MIRRIAALVALTVPALAIGCAAPVEERELVGTDQAALDTDTTITDDLNGKELALVGLSGNTLTAINSRGETITTTFESSTTFRPANLNKYIPTDPCREHAVNYNTLAASDGVSTLGGFVTNSCKAQVWISSQTGTVRAFRPVG